MREEGLCIFKSKLKYAASFGGSVAGLNENLGKFFNVVKLT